MTSSIKPPAKLKKCYLISTYVPEDYLEHLLTALLGTFKLDYGENYCGVYWRSTAGRERFHSGEKANPAYGEPGRITSCASIKIEFTIKRNEPLLAAVVETIYQHHCWQVPVITVTEGKRLIPQSL